MTTYYQIKIVADTEEPEAVGDILKEHGHYKNSSSKHFKTKDLEIAKKYLKSMSKQFKYTTYQIFTTEGE